MKSGWTTSEFWVTVLTIILSLIGPKLQQVLGVTQEGLLALVSNVAPVLAAIAYALSRGKVKAAALAPVDPKTINGA